MKAEIEMLEHEVIEESHSEWSALIVLVKKKDGTLRLCVGLLSAEQYLSDGCIPNASN